MKLCSNDIAILQDCCFHYALLYGSTQKILLKAWFKKLNFVNLSAWNSIEIP